MVAVSSRKTMICGRADKILGATAAAIAAAAGAGIVGTETTVDADIVNRINVNIPIPNSFAGVYLNVLTGVTGGSGGGTPGWNLNPYGATYLRWFTGNGGGVVLRTGGGGVANIPYGTLVGPTPGFGGFSATGSVPDAFTTGNEPWNPSSSDNIIGFRFTNAVTSTTNYGWMHLSMGATFSDPRTIISYGFEDSGLAITAVPEPSTLGLLVSGAIGLIASRRRRVA